MSQIKPEVQAIIDRHAAIDWTHPPHDPVAAEAAYHRRLAATGLTRKVRWIADPSEFGAWDARDVWWAAWAARDAIGYLNITIEPQPDWLAQLIATYEPMIATFESGAFAHFLLESEIVVLAAAAMHIDERGRLHRDDGPALSWTTTKVWAWRGVVVPEYLILEPAKITSEIIEKEENQEVRRVMIERYGYERYAGNSKVIHEDEVGKLRKRRNRRGDEIAIVEVVNGSAEPDGTHKRYFLSVPPECRTATEAVAWTYGMSADEYLRLQIRT